MTEAKIKQDARLRLLAFRQTAEPRVTRAMLDVACNDVEALLAELDRNRHLLEAGERLAAVTQLPFNKRVMERKGLAGSWTAIPTGDFDLIRAAQAAYQEAAKA